MKSTTPSEIPQLAPPGAGIPWASKLVLRLFVGPFVSAKAPWEVSKAQAEKVHAKILKEIEGLSDLQMQTRVLVPPQRGLEDSSRYWSIAMVLEHIVIVGDQIFQLIPALSNGIVPPGKADTALVKPVGEISVQQSVADFKKYSTTDFVKLNSLIKDKNSKTKFKHPWFGNMNAQQWYWLISIHAGLHLKQIREIKKRLEFL